jgi:hypothetical protein
LRDAFLRTPDHEASWLFLTSPASRSRIVLAFRDAIALCAILPALVCYGVSRVHGAAIENPVRDLASSAAGAYVMLQLMTAVSPALPLSQSPTQMQWRVLSAVPIMLVGSLIMFGFKTGLAAGAVAAPLTAAAAGAIILGLNRLTRWRVARARPASP